MLKSTHYKYHTAVIYIKADNEAIVKEAVVTVQGILISEELLPVLKKPK
jgi:hypothetical protein